MGHADCGQQMRDRAGYSCSGCATPQRQAPLGLTGSSGAAEPAQTWRQQVPSPHMGLPLAGRPWGAHCWFAGVQRKDTLPLCHAP